MGNEIVSITGYLNNDVVKKRFKDMLGERAPQFISSIISAVSLNNMLQKCQPESVVAAAAVAASLDLPINPSLGMAHIVPFREKDAQKPRAQFQLGWKGFIQLAIRTGQYRHINIADIREGDIKSINRFTGVITFNENQVANFTTRPIVGYLLYFLLVTGYEKYFYMSREECEAHGRKYSKSYETGNWKKDFDGMARKTVVKMGLSKYGIMSVEMQKAITTDQAIIDDEGNVINYPDNAAIDEAIEIIDQEVKIEQTPRQVYETMKLQLQSVGQSEWVQGAIRDHCGISNHTEKDFDDNDIDFLVKAFTKKLEAMEAK